jgi:capsid portal protein
MKKQKSVQKRKPITQAKRQTQTKIQTNKTKKDVFEFGLFELAVPQNIEEPLDLSKIRTKFIPFGQNNLFPQYLAELKRQSSTHRSVLAQKTIFTSGAKFVTNNESLKEYISDVNADGENLRDVYKKLADDYYTFGNAYLEVVLYDGGANMYHLDSTTVRMAKNKKEVYVHPDWAKYQTMKDKLQVIPLYSFQTDLPMIESNRFVVHFKDYEPMFNFYGLPDYVAALEHIAVDYEIGKWNHTKFKNGFQPSAIVEISGDMGEEEAQEMVKEAQKKFVGDGNNGKILFIVKNGDTSPANVQMIKDDQDGSWLDLQKITDQNIITAHRWQPSLSGIVSSGKMNNTGSEIRIAYDLAMTTVIRDTSELLLNGIRKVLFKELGYSKDALIIHYEPPISYVTDIDVKQVLTINEQRKLLDEDFVLLEDGDMFIADREIIVTQRDDDGDGEVDETEEVTVEQ